MSQERLFGRNSFKVAAHHLLLARNYAQLHRGGERGVEFELGFDAGALEQRFNTVAGLVVAHDGKQCGTGADAGNVARNIGRTAEALFRARDAIDWYGGLRRNALGVSEPITVEHGVASDEHASFAENGFVHE